MKRTIKAWAFPYWWDLACPDGKPDQIVVQRGPHPEGMIALEPGQSRADGTVCMAVPVTISWDLPKGAKRKPRRKASK